MSIRRYTVSAMGRHVKEQRTVLRSRPDSPGSCLAHKESSKSPFLPAFLPMSFCSCTSSRSLLSSVLSVPLSASFLLPFLPLLLTSLLSNVPFSQPSRMLMHARSATVLAGPPALNPRISRFPSSSSSSFSFP